ncbi:neurogenic locus notch homolog protein 1-like [Dendronephthya gigantea]|uniref:neurogenic locus notch homolog protein 1-like n=1 Tax=Dendronephthya gigantea TaxID=151771 RepID=UPI0010699540|nr:neurogenic locus notch homolog protein 1-like [Dendronephthya gigantea]
MRLIWVWMVILVVPQVSTIFWSRRRRRSPSPRNCEPGPWRRWSSCTHRCGNAGMQTRTRGKDVTECCGGSCHETFSESQPCNRNACRNGGKPVYGRCECKRGWKGTCCETYDHLCQPNPCQHDCDQCRDDSCVGDYTCSCYSCYTKVGTRCELRQCRIGSRCYSYGRVNPSNPCQDCQSSQKTRWTNNNALSCSDGNLCTKNDRCVNGVCVGTPFTCRSCESCDGTGCVINPGYCVIDGICYTNGNLRPGNPCQQCNDNYQTKWSEADSTCSDNNEKTRDDSCVKGVCKGEPYSCLPCEDHHNDVCRLKSGNCSIKLNDDVYACYRANTTKPGNLCQWCNPDITTSAWTKRNGTTCDDGEMCTRSDKCRNGQCGGISFQCTSPCQYCDGNGCSLHPGFGYVAGNCTCKIAGKDYSHQQINPNNECQWCDLYHNASKRRSVWTNIPSISCNDNNACTKNDFCYNGRCVGDSYSCNSSYPQSSCIQRSECMGNGSCKDIMRNKGTICDSAEDKCDQPER